MRVSNSNKLQFILFAFLFVTAFRGFAQCPKADAYLSKAEQGQQYSFAGDFEIKKCQCLAGVSSERAKELQAGMKYDKDQYERFKSYGDPNLGSIPTCVIVSSAGSQVSGSSDCTDIDKFVELSREKRYYNDAARFMQFKCNCLDAVYKTKEAQESAMNSMKYYKGTYDNQKRAGDPELIIPSQCKTGSGGTGASNDKFQQMLQNYSKAYNIVQQSQDRAAKVASEVKKFNSISSSGDPFKIMDEYEYNLKQIEEIEEQLKHEINRNDFEVGQQIGSDVVSRNEEGLFWTGLSLIGKSLEDSEAKKEVARQRAVLEMEKEDKMLQAARQLIKVNETARDKWLESAGLALEEDKEKYFLEKALYHNAFVNHIDSKFNYSNTDWARNPYRAIEKPQFKSGTALPLHTQYVAAAERKYEYFKKYQKNSFLEGAVKFMSAAVNERKNYAPYHLKFAEMAADYDQNLSLANYLTANELDDSLVDAELMRSVSDKYVTQAIHIILRFTEEYNPSINNSSPIYTKSFYEEPLTFIKEMVQWDFHLIQLSHNSGSYPNPVSPFEYAVLRNPGVLRNINLSGTSNSKFKKDLIQKALHFAVLKNEPKDLGVLLELGADVDLKSGKHNAITLANESFAYKVYPTLLEKSKDKVEYESRYKNSAYNYISDIHKDPSSFIEIANSMEDNKLLEEVIKKIIQLKWVDPLWQEPKYDSEIMVALGLYDEPLTGHVSSQLHKINGFEDMKLKPSFFRFVEKSFFDAVSRNRIDNTDENLSRVFIESNILLLAPNLLPSDDIVFDTEYPPYETFKDSTCLACILEVPLKERVKALRSYYLKKLENLESKPTPTNGYYASYLFYDGYLKNVNFEQKHNDENINLEYNRLVSREQGLPEINFERGIVQRPIDFRKESYPHIALLSMNYPLLLELSKKYDLKEVRNKKGESLIEYINILISEDSRFITFAGVPGLIDQFEWMKPINGVYPIHILEGLGEYKLISELNERGGVDINFQDENGMTILHRYLLREYDLWHESGLMEWSDNFLSDPQFGTPVEYLYAIDKGIKDNKGQTAWSLINSLDPWFVYGNSSYKKEAKVAKKEWKKALK